MEQRHRVVVVGQDVMAFHGIGSTRELELSGEGREGRIAALVVARERVAAGGVPDDVCGEQLGPGRPCLLR